MERATRGNIAKKLISEENLDGCAAEVQDEG